MNAKRPAPQAKLPENADIWIMAGQSNMEGCGYLREALAPDRRVWCFTLRHRWEIARDPMHDLINSAAPVDWKFRVSFTPAEIVAKGDKAIRAYWVRLNDNIGAGLGIAFGSAYAKATGRPVGLIAAAHGGTSLEHWNPSRKGEGLESLYGAMLERLRLSGRKPKGILWYQGESDADDAASATYAERFTQWVAAVRRDTGLPKLPVVTVQLGCVSHPNNAVGAWNRMRHTQLELARKIVGVAATSAIDLGLNDTIHIDASGLARLGRRMARLAVGLVQKRKALGEGPRFAKFVHRTNDRKMGETDLHFTGVTGEWRPERQMAGFSLLGADGQPHPTNAVSAAFRHPRRKNVIVVRTNVSPLPGERIAYGHGLFPTCNVVDAADMPLPAFEVRFGG